MDQQLVLALLAACVIGLVGVLLVVRRQRREHEDESRESPIAMSSEGVKLCPFCATENLWSDTRCLGCGRHLSDAPPRVG